MKGDKKFIPLPSKSLSLPTPEFIKQANSLKFSPLELAQLLDAQEHLNALKPSSRVIKIMHEGDTVPLEYDIDHFRRVMGIRYLSHLKFADYALLKEVIKECPLILRSIIGKENRELGDKYRKEIQEGFVANVTIKWIDNEMGYGVFTNVALPEGSFIGEYTGIVRELDRSRPDYNAYSFHYPTRFWSWNYYIIDGLWEGNEMRFLNHNDDANLKPICLVDRGLLHMAFLTNRAVSAGSELTFQYGPDYWQHRIPIVPTR